MGFISAQKYAVVVCQPPKMFAKEIWNGAAMSANAPHVRFAQVVLARFSDLELDTDEEVRQAGGPSTSTMTKLRNAATKGTDLAYPRGDTRKNIEVAAQWVAGSVKRVWNGGDPEVVGRPEQDADYVSSPGSRKPSGVTNEEVLRELRDMQRRIEELSERLADG